jgi:hypothetical protein
VPCSALFSPNVFVTVEGIVMEEGYLRRPRFPCNADAVLPGGLAPAFPPLHFVHAVVEVQDEDLGVAGAALYN